MTRLMKYVEKADEQDKALDGIKVIRHERRATHRTRFQARRRATRSARCPPGDRPGTIAIRGQDRDHALAASRQTSRVVLRPMARAVWSNPTEEPPTMEARAIFGDGWSEALSPGTPFGSIRWPICDGTLHIAVHQRIDISNPVGPRRRLHEGRPPAHRVGDPPELVVEEHRSA